MYKNIHYVIVFVFCSFALCAGVFLVLIDSQWVDFSHLAHYNPGKPSVLLDDEGNEWARFQLDRREVISYEHLPTLLIQAFIAAEDWDFFTHVGIALKGIVRSILINLYYGRIVQGASTITQQLVKLLYFDAQKTFLRKIKEQLCALMIERQFTKQQILETYINHIYFGCGVYGVQAASQRFWGIDVRNLTLDQAALLAGIVRSPARYCPLLCPLSAQRRRNTVLSSMYKLNFISQYEYEQAIQQPVTLLLQKEEACAPHLKETLRMQLEELVGREKLYTGGLRIQTTINQEMQRHAQRVFKEQVDILRKNFVPNIDGSLLTIEVQTGDIKVLVGGYNFSESKFNRALQAKRQVGSVFKPLVYAIALESGLQFFDTEKDEPLELKVAHTVWKPHNYNKKFNGTITLAYALSRSNNIVTIKTLLKVGIRRVVALAQRCGLHGPFHTYPSLALGTIDASLKEVVGMFAIFAHNGIYQEPQVIKWIKDEWGNKIFKQETITKKVLPSWINDSVAYVLSLSPQRMQNYFGKQWLSVPVMSKTGTTNKSRTCWYIGSTPTYTTGVYVGCDDNCSLGNNVYPIKTALPIWLAFNKGIVQKIKEFSFDSHLKEIVIHEKTGELLFNENHPHAIKILV